MNGADDSHDSWRMAEARSAAYALIAAGFREPSALPLPLLASIKSAEQAMAPLLGTEGGMADACRALLQVTAELTCAGVPLAPAIAELEEEYVRLFGHAVRGACPPYELEYGPGEIVQRAPDLADIAGFYAAFGLETGPESDRPDHVTAQCEFLSVLCAKESVVRKTIDAERVEQCRSAQRAFLRDHLAWWLPALTHRIGDRATTHYYQALARFGRTFIEAECRRMDLPAGPVWLELRAADPERDTAIECGPEDQGVPGGRDRLVQLGMPSS